MNICVITPFYPVLGRDDIKTDTQAIHLLLKYLVKENSIHVFNINRINPRHLFKSIFKKGNSLRTQYDYTIDGIQATMLRYRAFPKQRQLTKAQVRAVKESIVSTLSKNGFIPDVIVVHLPTAFSELTSGIYERARKIAIMHRTDINFLSNRNSKISIIDSQYDLVACRSQSIRTRAEELGITVANQIVYSGIPREYLDETRKHDFGGLDKCVKLLYVGKLIERKHPEYMLDLCEDLNKNGIHASVTIIGEGPLKEKLNAVKASSIYGSEMELISSLERDEVQKYMQAADIFVLPSVNETLGLVYLEAMAAGCITVGVKNEGIDGIIIDCKNGFLVEPENYTSLYECVSSVIRMEKSQVEMISQNAIDTACNCPEEVASENYLRIIS